MSFGNGKPVRVTIKMEVKDGLTYGVSHDTHLGMDVDGTLQNLAPALAEMAGMLTAKLLETEFPEESANGND